MKRVKTIVVGAVAVCAFCVMAAPTLAAEFVSPGGITKGKGGEQTLLLPPFIITCGGARTAGEAHQAEPEQLLDRISFNKCRTQAHLNINPIHLKTLIREPLVVVYHAGGFVESGGLEEPQGEAWLASGSVEIRVPALKQFGEACVISWEEQKIPNASSVKFTNIPLPQGRTGLEIENTFSEFEFEYGGGQCEAFNQAGKLKKQGQYIGNVTDEIAHRSLEWRP